MPISCAVLADIALSLPVKTLTLPAIETSERPEQFSQISEYRHPGRLGPGCHNVDVRTVRPASRRLDRWRQERDNLSDQGLGRNPRTRSMGRRFIVTKHATGSDLLNQKKKEGPINGDVLGTRVVDGIAVITLASAGRTYFDEGTGDAIRGARRIRARPLHLARLYRDCNPGSGM